MIQKLEIQEKLEAVASGKLPLWRFYDWFEEASWNMHKDSAQDAMDLAGTIKLLFADYDLRSLNQDELFDKLISLIHSVVIFDYSPNVAQVNITPIWWSADSQFAPLQATAVPQLL
jgi:hypothetical protein